MDYRKAIVWRLERKLTSKYITVSNN